MLQKYYIQLRFTNFYLKNHYLVTNNTSTLNYVLLFVKNDVIIFDIELDTKRRGLEIAEEIREKDKNCYFIFITGHLEYGFVAFQCKTFDYLPKPISGKRLEQTIMRLFDDINGSNKKFIKLDNKNTIIEESEIKYIKKDGMKIIFHTSSRDYEVYSSFAKIENELPDSFVRCHKSFIANINNITKVEPVSNMVYFNDSSCDIGPKYKNNFIKVVNHFGDVK